MDTHYYNNTLPEFEKECNYYELIIKILNDMLTSDTNKLNSIKELRRFNKHQKQAFSLIFDVVYTEISKRLLTEDDNIITETLLLTYDLFKDSWSYDNIREWITVLLPAVLTVSKSNNTYALECLNSCANNMFFEETILILLNDIENENAWITLRCLLINFDPTMLINSINWDEVIYKISEIFTVKYQYAEEMFSILKQKLLREDIFIILRQVQDDDILMLCFNLLEYKHKDRIDFYNN
jgi:hypothetical protein